MHAGIPVLMWCVVIVAAPLSEQAAQHERKRRDGDARRPLGCVIVCQERLERPITQRSCQLTAGRSRSRPTQSGWRTANRPSAAAGDLGTPRSEIIRESLNQGRVARGVIVTGPVIILGSATR
jgi:hypothetical protein